jgi:hypothetical protein
MNRRTIIVFGLLSAAFAMAASQVGLTQSNLLIGTWKLNLDKSKFNPGPPPKSQTLNVEAAGQDLKNTVETIDAPAGSGDAKNSVHAYHDGKPHPTTGIPAFDATTSTPSDAATNWVRSKADKAVQTGSNAVSSDGRTFYGYYRKRTGANGQPISSVRISRKAVDCSSILIFRQRPPGMFRLLSDGGSPLGSPVTRPQRTCAVGTAFPDHALARHIQYA